MEPVPSQLWIAIRSPEIRGSGTENDPYNGCTLNNVASQLGLTITSNGTTTISAQTSSNHGYQNGDIVLVEGFSTSTLYMVRGAFAISVTGLNTFTFVSYAIWPPVGVYAGGTCRLDPYLFDAVMRSISQGGPMLVHLGPGTFETKGSEDCLGGADGVQPAACWRPWSGLKILGSGISVTTLKLVQAVFLNRPYYAVGCPTMLRAFDPLIGFEASDFTIDCNIAGQVNPSLTCAAIFVRGSHTRIRRIRVINFGRQGSPVPQTQECFVIGVAGSEYVTSLTDGERYDCIVEECIIERPGLRSVRETTLLHFFGNPQARKPPPGPITYDGFPPFNLSCVFRNCYFDGMFVDKPVRVASIAAPVSMQSKVVTTDPHGLSAGQWFKIYGAYDSGYDNGYVGSFVVDAAPAPTTKEFYYTPTDPAPTAAPMAQSEIWIGKYPSIRLGVQTVARSQVTTSPNEWEMTVTTRTAHFFVPGSSAVLVGTSPADPELGPYTSVNGEWTVIATGLGRRSFKCRRIYPAGVVVDAISNYTFGVLGSVFQAVAMSGAKVAVMEGNQVFNCLTGGPYSDTGTTGSWVVRGNHYRGVRAGPNQNMGRATNSYNSPNSQIIAATLTRSGTIATFAVAPINGVPVPHGLVTGQPITIANAKIGGITSLLYNGTFVVLDVDLANNAFTYQMNGTPSASADTSPAPTVASLEFTRDLLIEKNVFEILPSVDSALQRSIAINIAADPVPPYNTGDFRAFGNVTVRGNVVRYLPAPDGQPLAGNVTLDDAVLLTYVTLGLVENNIIDCANSRPLRHFKSGIVNYFNNRTPAGALIRGVLDDRSTGSQVLIPQDELTTLIQDALSLGFL
jgi:hypothetical protein